MTNYEKYQLQWMIDHNYSIKDMIEGMNEVYKYRTHFDYNSPMSIFVDWEADIGFNGSIWDYEEKWIEREEKNNPKPKFYLYQFRFCADLPLLSNTLLSKDDLKDIAMRKLTRLPFKFQNAEIKEIKYDFNFDIHFQAEIEAVTNIVFCVNSNKNFIEAFRKAIHTFETCDNGNGIGLIHINTLSDCYKSIEDFSETQLIEITEQEAKIYGE